MMELHRRCRILHRKALYAGGGAQLLRRRLSCDDFERNAIRPQQAGAAT
jgi:hypothetical protein